MAVFHVESDGAIKAPKLASVVARRLEDEVVERGWPVGEVLGSETELLDRFGVSRAVLREAVRIVEHTGAARMRRGPGGGLVVSEPDRTAVVAAMGVWFSFTGVTIAELLEARAPLLSSASRLAAQRADRAGLEVLKARVEQAEARGGVSSTDVVQIEAALASLTGNPALVLFIDSLADISDTRLLTGRASIDPPVGRKEGMAYIRGYRLLAEAIAGGDPDVAARRMGRLSDALSGRLVEVKQRRTRRSRELPPGGKLAERVALALRDDIERASWPVGVVLGSETELIERYEVSRAILREAVRILEYHGAVRTKRGPQGGLIVTAPDSGSIVRAARNLLEYDQLTQPQLIEARAVVEGAAVRLAALRCTPELAVELRVPLSAEAGTDNAADSFRPVHRGLALVTGNRLFELFVQIVAELVPSRVGSEHQTPARAAAISAEAHRAHERIIEAVTAGDADLAEQRMLRHLRASAHVLR